jgi:hypothetical protein
MIMLACRAADECGCQQPTEAARVVSALVGCACALMCCPLMQAVRLTQAFAYVFSESALHCCCTVYDSVFCNPFTFRAAAASAPGARVTAAGMRLCMHDSSGYAGLLSSTAAVYFEASANSAGMTQPSVWSLQCGQLPAAGIECSSVLRSPLLCSRG